MSTHYIKYKKTSTICRWKGKLGLKLKENQTYEDIYDIVQNTTNCELCNVELCDGIKSNGRCMDHCHETGYFRKVLCRKCNVGYKREIQKNNKSGIRGISQRRDDLRWVYRYGKNPLFSNKNKQIVLWYKYVYMILKR